MNCAASVYATPSALARPKNRQTSNASAETITKLPTTSAQVNAHIPQRTRMASSGTTQSAVRM